MHAFVSLISLSAMSDTLTSTTTWTVVWFTTWQAALSVVATLIVALPITWVLSRFSFPGKKWVRGIVSTPFVLPTVVVAGAVMSLLPLKYQFGAHGIIIAHVLFNIAVVVRIVGSRWQTLPLQQVQAAQVLGASPLQTFLHVTVPQLRRALYGAGLVIFLFSFTSFGVVAVLGGLRRRTIEVEIYTNAIRLGFFDTAMALAVIQLFAIVFVFVLSTMTRRSDPDGHGHQVPLMPLNRYPRHRSFIVAIAVLTPAVIAFPFISLFIRSFRSGNQWTFNAWRNLWNGSLERVGLDIPATLTRSLLFAACAMLIATPMAYIVSSFSVYMRRGGHIVRGISAAPIVISAVTLGFGIIVTFNQSPYDWRGETWLLPMIHGIIALPIAVYVLTPALQAVPPQQRDAARTLGASPLRVWWHIDARLMRTPATATAAMSFAVSLGEFGATTFLIRSSSTTLPIAISQLLGRPGTTLQASGFALAALLALIIAVVMSRA
jgi:thiamine transport system permease protein